jgi:HEAT repeat protein
VTPALARKVVRMRCYRQVRKILPNRSGLIALAVVVAAASLARADRFPPDPVPEFRQALAMTLQDYMPRDPEAAAKLDRGSSEERLKYLLARRNVELMKALDKLKTMSEMRRALAAQEWRLEKGLDDKAAVDEKVREVLIQRFAAMVIDTLDNGSLDAKLATLTMLAELGENNRIVDDRKRVARVFTPVLTKMIKTAPSPIVRDAAARSVSRLGCDPDLAAPVLGELLRSKLVSDRRAAADGLGSILGLLNDLANSNKSPSTSESPAPNITPAGVSLMTFARREVISAGKEVLPFARIGMNDSDVEVRRLCTNCMYQAVLGLSEQVPQPYITRGFADQTFELERNQTMRKDLTPLMQALNDQADVMGKATHDSSLEVRLLAFKAIEELSSAQGRMAEVEGVPPKEGDVFLDFMRKVMPEVIQGVSAPEVQIRLLSVDALEVLGKEMAPAAPALVAGVTDSNKFVRWGAARCLGRAAPVAADSAVPALARLLFDDDLDLRLAAATSLQAYGPAAQPALPAMIAGTTTTDVVQRISALKTIAAVGTGATSAVPAIIVALSDPEARVRRTAADVLGQFGTLAPQAEQPLREALNDPSADVRRAASDALLNVLGNSKK